MSKALKRWMAAATPEQKARLAWFAKTSVGVLGELASGRSKASSAAAIRIEKAAAHVKGWGTQQDWKLPKLNRMDLNETCAKCEYAKRCRP